jgi:hypothetical protein
LKVIAKYNIWCGAFEEKIEDGVVTKNPEISCRFL